LATGSTRETSTTPPRLRRRRLLAADADRAVIVCEPDHVLTAVADDPPIQPPVYRRVGKRLTTDPSGGDFDSWLKFRGETGIWDREAAILFIPR
jgi:hypothetical protein